MTDRHASQAGGTIDFAERLANSETFSALFRDGMGLVEETASYLDGDGRAESKSLPRAASLAYATESMRLTTRLMQMASWLLLQRAVNEGEMSTEQAGSEKNKVRLDGVSPSRDGSGWEELPEMLKSLIERSVRLQERIVHLDRMIQDSRRKEAAAASRNPVAAQLHALNAAFGTVGH
ncbi:protease adaptor protein RcdA [Stappia sp.]|jgi:regulator of CtrA degradation|uniref:protease adaptor protein RcdA n=1 Tax=Stappia sp. TaxID=1870903 RepID=UPI003A9A4717